MNYKILRSTCFYDFKENFNITLKFSGILSLFLLIAYFILSLVLLLVPPLYAGILGQLFLLLVIWLLIYWIAPYFYSFHATNDILLTIINGKEAGLSYFLANRKTGKRREFRNALRIWRHLGFSILIYFLASIIVSLIYYFVSQAIGSENGLYHLLVEITNISNNIGITSEDKITLINELINLNYSVLHRYNSVVSFLSLSIAFYYFLHNISISFINYQIVFKNGPSNSATFPLFKSILKSKEVNYYKDYFKVFYPFYILTFIIFTSIYLLMYFFLPNTITTVISSTSIIITVLVLLPFLPLLLNFNHYKKFELIAEYYQRMYKDMTFLMGGDEEGNLEEGENEASYIDPLNEDKSDELTDNEFNNSSIKNDDDEESILNPFKPPEFSKEEKDMLYNQVNHLKALAILYKYHVEKLNEKLAKDKDYLKHRRKLNDINSYFKESIKEKSNEMEAVSILIENNFDTKLLDKIYDDENNSNIY